MRKTQTGVSMVELMMGVTVLIMVMAFSIAAFQTLSKGRVGMKAEKNAAQKLENVAEELRDISTSPVIYQQLCDSYSNLKTVLKNPEISITKHIGDIDPKSRTRAVSLVATWSSDGTSKTRTLNFTLAPTRGKTVGGKVILKVVDARDGVTGIPGVALSLTGQDKILSECTGGFTQANGVCEIEDVKISLSGFTVNLKTDAAHYYVEDANKGSPNEPGVGKQTTSVLFLNQVTEGGLVDLSFSPIVLFPLATLKGKVTVQNSEVGNVKVLLWPDPASLTLQGFKESIQSTLSSGEVGQFSFTNVSPGKYLVYVLGSAQNARDYTAVAKGDVAGKTPWQVETVYRLCSEGNDKPGNLGACYSGSPLALTTFPRISAQLELKPLMGNNNGDFVEADDNTYKQILENTKNIKILFETLGDNILVNNIRRYFTKSIPYDQYFNNPSNASNGTADYYNVTPKTNNFIINPDPLPSNPLNESIPTLPNASLPFFTPSVAIEGGINQTATVQIRPDLSMPFPLTPMLGAKIDNASPISMTNIQYIESPLAAVGTLWLGGIGQVPAGAVFKPTLSLGQKYSLTVYPLHYSAYGSVKGKIVIDRGNGDEDYIPSNLNTVQYKYVMTDLYNANPSRGALQIDPSGVSKINQGIRAYTVISGSQQTYDMSASVQLNQNIASQFGLNGTNLTYGVLPPNMPSEVTRLTYFCDYAPSLIDAKYKVNLSATWKERDANGVVTVKTNQTPNAGKLDYSLCDIWGGRCAGGQTYMTLNFSNGPSTVLTGKTLEYMSLSGHTDLKIVPGPQSGVNIKLDASGPIYQEPQYQFKIDANRNTDWVLMSPTMWNGQVWPHPYIIFACTNHPIVNGNVTCEYTAIPVPLYKIVNYSLSGQVVDGDDVAKQISNASVLLEVMDGVSLTPIISMSLPVATNHTYSVSNVKFVLKEASQIYLTAKAPGYPDSTRLKIEPWYDPSNPSDPIYVPVPPFQIRLGTIVGGGTF